jgi:hypothetical protein
MSENTILIDDLETVFETHSISLNLPSTIISMDKNSDIIYRAWSEISTNNITPIVTISGDVYSDSVLTSGHRILVIDRDSGELVGKTFSDSNGHYDIGGYINSSKKYIIIALDKSTIPSLQAIAKDYMDSINI